MEERLEYKLEQLKSAIQDFSHSLTIDLALFEADIADVVKNGQVQKFEFSVELLWKVIKTFLEELHGFDEKSPKSAVKRFFLLGYLSERDYEVLMNSLNDRNRLSHIYNKKQFDEVYRNIGDYSELFMRILEVLQND